MRNQLAQYRGLDRSQRVLAAWLLASTAAILFTAVAFPVPAAVPAPSPGVDELLPEGTRYDPDIPTPEEVLGFKVGEWHVRPDLLVNYAREIARISPRVTLQETGRTHEERPLLLLTITSPANQGRIEALREAHLKVSNGGAPDDLSGMPVVTWMGYSVHGNEPSGSNASLAVLYHLAAGQGREIEALLQDSIILLDPAVNPDGLGRFAHWANSHKGKVLNPDPNSREHREAWPSGRTNHYWFDLNRDWLPLVHPESRARIKQFHRWRPNVLTDFHEMGTNSTYFFQPGIPSRQNPLTPGKNLELTRKIATYHAKALDGVGQTYYTEESFDDFYYGKGSTYPDVHGSIGILFEQASSRGHLQDSVNGPLAFTTTVRNQILTSLSTLRAAHEMRTELLEYQQTFFDEARKGVGRKGPRGYVFHEPADLERLVAFIDVLRQHAIEVKPLSRDLEMDGVTFSAGSAWAVDLSQTQGRLAHSLFEQRTSFVDASFYDVSAWNLAMAYGLEFRAVSADRWGRLATGEATAPLPTIEGGAPSPADVAYAFDWGVQSAPALLAALQSRDLKARVATSAFDAKTAQGVKSFARGSIVVPVGIQPLDADALHRLVDELSSIHSVVVHSIQSGLTPEGIDLGSPSLRPIQQPKVLLVAGGGMSSYRVGEFWHALDVHLKMPVTIVDAERMGRIDLGNYTHVVLTSGRPAWDERQTGRVQAWLQGGGTLIAIKDSIRWVADQGWAAVTFKGEPTQSENDGEAKENREGDPAAGNEAKAERASGPAPTRRYESMRADAAKKLVAGTIFQSYVDLSHPLGYGFPRAEVPTFRNGTLALEPSANPYGTVARYSEQPLLAGYASDENRAKLAGSASVIVERSGRGRVVLMTDMADFRGFWWGTRRFWSNALFLSTVVSFPRGADEDAAEADQHDH